MRLSLKYKKCMVLILYLKTPQTIDDMGLQALINLLGLGSLLFSLNTLTEIAVLNK